MTNVVELIRGGRTAEARETQLRQATPLADQLERLTNQLVNKAEADMVAGIEASSRAYTDAQWIVISFALGSIVLALALGYAISWSVLGPVKEIETQLNKVAAGDFSRRVHVINRDELGALAADVNRMSEELGGLYEQLESFSKNKSQFLASMSHELRTPLNAIIGLSEMLVKHATRFGTEKAAEPLQRIHRAGTHLLGLVNQVLDLSKIEAGKLELSPEQVNLAPLIDDVAGTARQLAEQKSNRLSVDYPRDLGSLLVDPMRLRQILLNLLSNACKFTERANRIAAGAANGSRWGKLDRVRRGGHRHRHDSRADGKTVRGVLAGRGVDRAPVRRHRPRPRHHAQALPHDGRRRHRRERAGQGIGVHHPPAGRNGCTGRLE